jgi:hypothetical protein
VGYSAYLVNNEASILFDIIKKNMNAIGKHCAFKEWVNILSPIECADGLLDKESQPLSKRIREIDREYQKQNECNSNIGCMRCGECFSSDNE